ncbi:hypothetical protein OMO38_19190 [Chryseobacterium sp. 09-1422]|uniref:Uncharacterized protein n=1 Tax=Chryseobacterium kimseyorum TaxID=2984028 RepID=A0ABT3I431_9FLAO|nr:hypothetical protein [Chryseobacterium kimseyorum]MCW3170660.1 hypothetical protein [Chryseobacterium kimseyorum]
MDLEFKKEHFHLIKDSYSLTIKNVAKNLPIVQAYYEFSPGVYVSKAVQVMVSDDYIVINAEKGFDGKVVIFNDEISSGEESLN